MRRLIRWAVPHRAGPAPPGRGGAVAIILLLDTITKEIIVSRLRARTGMEAKISAVHVGLLSPTISIEGLKLYNTAGFWRLSLPGHARIAPRVRYAPPCAPGNFI
jgi:hypothetical protein